MHSRAVLDDCVEALNNDFISVSGLKRIRTDPNLTEPTMEKLKESERESIEKYSPEYLYLLDDHDSEQVYINEFIKGNCVGAAHLSQLTRRPGRTFADLCAEYSIDRGIPFLAGAVMLKDYLSVAGGFPVIDRKYAGGDTYYCLKRWTPENSGYIPPVVHSKLEKNKESSLPGLNDNYILQTYLDVGCRINGVAAVLGITRQAASKLLNETGLPSDIRKSPQSVLNWIREYKSDYETSRAEDSLSGTIDKNTKCCILPGSEVANPEEDETVMGKGIYPDSSNVKEDADDIMTIKAEEMDDDDREGHCL